MFDTLVALATKQIDNEFATADLRSIGFNACAPPIAHGSIAQSLCLLLYAAI
ncbi:MAG: hypothetical protein LBN32_03790 [Helicobacteraceae bacterium]|nr:hypothetical protein [Helicobacteraceae bacterium]